MNTKNKDFELSLLDAILPENPEDYVAKVEDVFDKWVYSGDVDLTYGGKYIKVYPEGYADIVEVTNLADAAGADGLLLIEYKTVCDIFDYKQVAEALKSWGWTWEDLFRYPLPTRYSIVADVLDSYGYSDVYKYTIVVHRDCYMGDKSTWDGWQVDRQETIRLAKAYGSDLRQYVESVWLD